MFTPPIPNSPGVCVSVLYRFVLSVRSLVSVVGLSLSKVKIFTVVVLTGDLLESQVRTIFIET